MGRAQYLAAALAALLAVVVYFGCPVRPAELEAGFRRGPLETTGLETLVRQARATLSPAQLATLATLDDRLASQEQPAERLDLLEQLAGEWYRAGHPAISGIYARRIAEQRNSADAWAIAGTTFSLCLKQDELADKTRQFCSSQAVAAYQAAISLEPDTAEHRVNLALTYADNPPPDNPMRGVLLLRELTEQFPNSPAVFRALGQLSLRTGQLENAARRFGRAAELAPNDPDAVCPLARVLEELGRSAESRTFADRCQELVKSR